MLPIPIDYVGPRAHPKKWRFALRHADHKHGALRPLAFQIGMIQTCGVLRPRITRIQMQMYACVYLTKFFLMSTVYLHAM